MFFIDGTKKQLSLWMFSQSILLQLYLPSYLEAVEDAPMNINGVYITDSDIQHDLVA